MPHSISVEMGALARDPHTVFLYWRVAADGPAPPDGRWLLRARDVADDAVREVEVDPMAGTYYMNVEPGHTYEFELALKRPDGLNVVCRSAPVQVPPDGPAAAFAARFGRARPPVPDGQAPGLDYETTALFLGSSGPTPPEGSPTPQPPCPRDA